MAVSSTEAVLISYAIIKSRAASLRSGSVVCTDVVLPLREASDEQVVGYGGVLPREKSVCEPVVQINEEVCLALARCRPSLPLIGAWTVSNVQTSLCPPPHHYAAEDCSQTLLLRRHVRQPKATGHVDVHDAVKRDAQ